LGNRTSNKPVLNISEVKSAFEGMHIKLSFDEINCLLFEYDTTGKGEQLFLKEMEEDYESYKWEKEKNLRNP
jgi:hypothetical protein